MKNIKSPQKIKDKQKNNRQAQKDVPLPEYLSQLAPVFHTQQRCISNDYFANNSTILDQDLPKCEQLLKNLIAGQKQTEQKISQLKQFTFDDSISFNSGMSFYSCKNMLFNEYLICLKFYQLFRLNNSDLTSGPGLRLYQRLVYLKTLILKLSPVEKKLQYQKNKLLKKGQKIKIIQFKHRTQKEKDLEQQQQNKQQQRSQSKQSQNLEQDEQQNQQDNLAYKPMIKNLISDKISKKPQKQLKYVAPKQSSVLPAQQKVKLRQQRQKQRRKAFLLRKFRGDIDSGDEAEQKGLLEDVDQKFKKKYQQKLRYQQENFTRLNETKKQKYWKKQMQKNRFKNTMNDQLKEIQLIRQLVQQEGNQDKRPGKRPERSTSFEKKPIKKVKKQKQ